TRRPVSVEGAYLERVVVNLDGGAGQTEVFLDDLRVAPVPSSVLASPARPGAGAGGRGSVASGGPPRKPGETSLVAFRLKSNVLEKLGPDRKRYMGWFPTAIEAAGASIGELRGAGFDVYVTSAELDRNQVESIVKAEFFLMPRLKG